MELTGHLMYLQIAGIFGWSSTPAAFQVITRAIQWELKHLLHSRILMYVEDIIGVCFAKDIVCDLAVTRNVCSLPYSVPKRVNSRLLGSIAIADDKPETGTRVDILGYTVDLTTHSVIIAKKNFLNTIYGFLEVDLTAPISLTEAQRLASWDSRYGKICRVMRRFVGALHRLTVGRTSHHATFDLTEKAKVAIRCWRAMLALIRFTETRFSRTMESFGNSAPCYAEEFDASLSGAGILWYRRLPTGAEECLGGSAVSLSCLGFGDDSSYQNICEFIRSILGIIGLLKLRKDYIELRGDSISALTWAHLERYRGSLVTNAAMVFTSLCIASEVDVKVATHIPGKENCRGWVTQRKVSRQ